MSSSLQLIEERIEKLEKLIQSIPEQDEKSALSSDTTSLNECLSTLYEKLHVISSNRDKIKEAFLKSSDLNTSLATLDEPSAPEKYRVVELRWSEMQERCAQLEALNNLLPVLDSEHLRNTPHLMKQLEALNFKQIEQRLTVKKSVEEINDLVLKYNEMIRLINKQFIVWDHIKEMVKKKNLSEKLAASKLRKIRQPSIVSKFEQKFTKEKHHVMGRKKSKSSSGKPIETKTRAFENRKKTLGGESRTFFKANSFVDRRLGENSSQISKEEKIFKRLAAERRKRYAKEKFNLNDENDDYGDGLASEQLTHCGQNLADIEKFELRGVDGQASDDEDEKMNANLNFGGGDENNVKSRKQVIEEMISKSKLLKHEKQSLKEEQHALTEQLDEQWRQLLQANLISFPKNKDQEQKNDVEKSSDFDSLVRELTFERRTAPAQDAKKSEKEIAEQEKSRIESLEREKRKRMVLEEENFATPVTHFNPDDIDSNCRFDSIGRKANQSDDEEEKDQELQSEDKEDFDQEFQSVKRSKAFARKVAIGNSDQKFTPGDMISCDVLESYPNLKKLLEKSNEIEQIFDRLHSSFNPSLKPGNKDLLRKLFLYLLRYFDEKSYETVIDFKLLDKITSFLFKLNDYGHEYAAKSFRALMKKHYQTLSTKNGWKLKKLRSIPSNIICFFRLLPHLFPTSDVYHPITTPSFLFLTEILSNLKPKSSNDISKSLILLTILMEYIKESKNYAPDLIHFLIRILNRKCFDEKELSLTVDDLSLSMLLNGQTVDIKIKSSSILSCILKLIRRLMVIYVEKASFPEIFDAMFAQIDNFSNMVIHQSLQHQIDGLKNDFTQHLSTFDRKKLQFKTNVDENKLKFEFHEPRLETNFNPDRKKFQFTKGPKAERAKLKRQYKNEYKGAVRELRRDNEFLARKKLNDSIAKDTERAEKTKRLMSSLMGQEADYKKMKKNKN
uniref:Nucleolar protein 14 n=1 Tax=Romanomermis culicivorax TaxID=13658 RepID=A0A915JG49_ROMCU